MNKTIKWALIIFLIIALIGGGVFWFLIKNSSKNNIDLSQFNKKLDPTEVVKEMGYEQNMDIKNVMEYVSLSEEEKEYLSPIYLLNVADSLKKAFFEERAMVKVVELYKKAFAKTHNRDVRYKVYDTFGNIFCDAVRSPAVAKELYRGDTEFSKLLKEANGDYSLAGRKMFERAYEIKKGFRPANMLSHWYAKQILVDKDKDKWAEYSKKMHEYMAVYEKEHPQLNGLMDFQGYWAAMSYAAFCKMGEKEYCKKYRDSINFYIHPEPQYSGTWAVLFSAYYYLTIDNNPERARKEIETHKSALLDDRSFPVQMLYNNERKRKVEHDLMYQVIDKVRKISPEVDKWVKKAELRDPIDPYKLAGTPEDAKYDELLKKYNQDISKIDGENK